MTVRLTNPDEDRYQRFRLIRWWDQERLKGARVLVLGAGALGNEVVKNLALLGVGKTWIVDFDKIETSNLTRSVLFRESDLGAWKAEVLAARAQEMNPDCRFEALRKDVRYDLGLHFFAGIDLVFGCLDNREARYFVNRYCYLLRKPYIDGGLETLNGSVTVLKPPQTPCYECTLSNIDRSELQKRLSCLKSLEPEIKHHVPTAPTVASVIGGLQVQIGVRELHGLDIPAGRRLGLYGLSDLFFDVRLEVSEDCGMHATADPLPKSIEELKASEEDPLERILELARNKWNSDALAWDFDRDLVTALMCTSCGKTESFVGTQGLYQGASLCACGGVYKPEIAVAYGGSEPWGNRSFRSLGFPSDHIYCATTQERRFYFTLNHPLL